MKKRLSPQKINLIINKIDTEHRGKFYSNIPKDFTNLLHENNLLDEVQNEFVKSSIKIINDPKTKNETISSILDDLINNELFNDILNEDDLKQFANITDNNASWDEQISGTYKQLLGSKLDNTLYPKLSPNEKFINGFLDNFKIDTFFDVHTLIITNEMVLLKYIQREYLSVSIYSIALLKKEIENSLIQKNLYHKFKSESNMMMTVFNEKNPLIKINNLSTPTEISEQEGFKFLITGLFKKYRNKYAHNQLEEIDKQECINVLFMVTECLDVLDNIPKSKYE